MRAHAPMLGRAAAGHEYRTGDRWRPRYARRARHGQRSRERAAWLRTLRHA